MASKGELNDFDAKLKSSVAATARYLKAQRFDLSSGAVRAPTSAQTGRALTTRRQVWLLIAAVAAIAIALAADPALIR